VSSGRQPGDRLRVLVAAAALFVGLPWLAAELGFFLNGVPLLGWLYQTGTYLPTVPGLPPFPPAVHHGHHHGMDGVLLLLTSALPTITARQRQVVELIAAGCSNDEVGERLGISPRTAKAHADALRQKRGGTSAVPPRFWLNHALLRGNAEGRPLGG